MPRGYWLYVLAAFGVVILAISLLAAAVFLPPNERADAEKRQAGEQVAERSSTALTLIAPQPIEQVNRAEPERPCQPGDDNRSSDLCAQWKAADGAAEAATWAKWSFLLGIPTTIALVLTLWLTRKATWAATRTVETQVAATRPIITMDSCKILSPPLGENPPKALRMKLHWKLINHGQTGCWIEGFAVVLEANLAATEPVAAHPINAFLGPGKTISGDTSDDTYWLLNESESMIAWAGGEVFVWGYVIYRNADGAKWRSGFAGRVPLDEDLRGEGFEPVASIQHWTDELIAPQRPNWRDRFRYKPKHEPQSL